ncbi:unnamed protein product [marine sediment metagenome]|uniref:Uncharacterized protein n=1 Tax=marine sediment metagenome TaxID=412755 RepID=X1TY69_9ZZZZ
MKYEDRISSELEAKARKAVGKTFDPSVIDRSILETFPYHLCQILVRVYIHKE